MDIEGVAEKLPNKFKVALNQYLHCHALLQTSVYCRCPWMMPSENSWNMNLTLLVIMELWKLSVVLELPWGI